MDLFTNVGPRNSPEEKEYLGVQKVFRFDLIDINRVRGLVFESPITKLYTMN